MGIRVTISRRRQKPKKSPAIIVSMCMDEGGLCAIVLGAAVFDATLESLRGALFEFGKMKKKVLCSTSRQCHSRLSCGLMRGSVTVAQVGVKRKCT